MIHQTLAMLLDAYRELNARKLFWITLMLSGLVVAVFGAIGLTPDGVTFLGMSIGFIPVNSDIIPRDAFYLSIFTSLGIGIWLTWIAAILALVSTASIVPDMISGGSIETMLSKPIGRVRLFLTKYFMALLFVTLQVGLFTVASFVVIGVRGGVWEIGLFLAIPIVVLFFSYLYCVCAFLGLITRSTIAALLLTLLFWGALFVVNMGDALLVNFREISELYVEQRTERVERAERNTIKMIRDDLEAAGTPDDTYQPTDEEMEAKNPFLASNREKLVEEKDDLRQLRMWSGIIFGIKTVLPKTGETSALLERHLIDLDDLDLQDDEPAEPSEAETAFTSMQTDIQPDQEEIQRRTQEAFRERSVWWVIGTSLLFEAFVLGLCCLIFRRRDF